MAIEWNVTIVWNSWLEMLKLVMLNNFRIEVHVQEQNMPPYMEGNCRMINMFIVTGYFMEYFLQVPYFNKQHPPFQKTF